MSRIREILSLFSTISQLPSVHSIRSGRPNVPIVGIVGGIGAGKSSVIRTLYSPKLHVIDADRIGHDQLANENIRDQIVRAFGVQVLDAAGQISRPLLAAEVFGKSQEQKKKRSQLDKIMHPAIREEIRKLMSSAPQDAEAIILDAALLLEAGWAEECDAIIFIDTSLEQRQQRVAETRGWSAAEHSRREASQWNLDDKRRVCKFSVDNSGSPKAAALEMEAILQEIIKQHKKE